VFRFKRLGTQRYSQLKKIQNIALTQQLAGQPHYRLNWLKPVLYEYYDRIYQYQLGLKTERVILTGNNTQCLAFLHS